MPSIGKIIFRGSTVRGTPHLMNPWFNPPYIQISVGKAGAYVEFRSEAKHLAETRSSHPTFRIKFESDLKQTREKYLYRRRHR